MPRAARGGATTRAVHLRTELFDRRNFQPVCSCVVDGRAKSILRIACRHSKKFDERSEQFADSSIVKTSAGSSLINSTLEGSISNRSGCYWGITSDGPSTFTTGGGFHLPVRACDFGA